MKFQPHFDGQIHHKVVLTLSWILIALMVEVQKLPPSKRSLVTSDTSDGTLWWSESLEIFTTINHTFKQKLITLNCRMADILPHSSVISGIIQI